jgi:hypothetical protein
VPMLLVGSAVVLQHVWRPDWRTRAVRSSLRLGRAHPEAGLPHAPKS